MQGRCGAGGVRRYTGNSSHSSIEAHTEDFKGTHKETIRHAQKNAQKGNVDVWRRCTVKQIGMSVAQNTEIPLTARRTPIQRFL